MNISSLRYQLKQQQAKVAEFERKLIQAQKEALEIARKLERLNKEIQRDSDTLARW